MFIVLIGVGYSIQLFILTIIYSYLYYYTIIFLFQQVIYHYDCRKR